MGKKSKRKKRKQKQAYVSALWDRHPDDDDDTPLISRQSITLPREILWAGGAAGLMLVITAWPVLILGVVLGAFGVARMGCPNFKMNNFIDKGDD